MRRKKNSTKATLFVRHFAALPDPRERRRHPLLNILFIALAATVSGAEGWEAMVSFAQGKREWLEEILELRRDIPSADTFRRVFQVLDPRAFEECFRSWVQALAQAFQGEVVAIDGKSSKGVTDEANPTVPLHLLHVWATKQRLLLAQRAVKGAPGEPAAALALLELLALDGAVVTADANLCTKTLAQKVRDRGGDYVLALKGNRGPIFKQVKEFWDQAEADGFKSTLVRRVRRVNKGHGREEERESFAAAARVLPQGATSWPGLRSIVMVLRSRRIGQQTSIERHYFISSLLPKVKALHQHVRDHWRVENDLHWSLDVAFSEDDSRIRDRRAAENFGMVRRMALQLLKRESTAKVGVPIRRLRAGWDTDYLVQVLSTGLA